MCAAADSFFFFFVDLFEIFARCSVGKQHNKKKQYNLHSLLVSSTDYHCSNAIVLSINGIRSICVCFCI